MEPAPGPAEGIQITSITTASPATPVPEPRAPDTHPAPPPDSGIPLDQPAHLTRPPPTQQIFPPVPIKMMGRSNMLVNQPMMGNPAMMPNPMGFHPQQMGFQPGFNPPPQPLQQIPQNTTPIPSPTISQGQWENFVSDIFWVSLCFDDSSNIVNTNPKVVSFFILYSKIVNSNLMIETWESRLGIQAGMHF